jgi:hypothetical protein
MSPLDRVLGPVPDAPSPSNNRGGDVAGSRESGPMVYQSHDLTLRSCAEKTTIEPVLKVYETEGPGADDDAIEHFRQTGNFDVRR